MIADHQIQRLFNKRVKNASSEKIYRDTRRKKALLIVVVSLVSFVVLITVLASIFAEIQKPRFVNRDLVMQNELI